MGNVTQLSAGEAFDDLTGEPLPEGYITLQTSAGNRVVFANPANMNAYRIANPGQFAGTPDSGGTFNQSDDTV
mgnify:FL=1